MIRFDVVTLFPELVSSVGRVGVAGRAIKQGIAELHCWDPRDFVVDRYRRVDDRPYGGGPGMVMMAPPLAWTLDAVRASQRATRGQAGRVVFMSPAGRKFSHEMARQWSGATALTLLCGRYEGVDQRLIDERVEDAVSLGDFILSGGELPAMAMIDAVIRLLPGALNDDQSAVQESFHTGLLDHPHFTRPEVWEGRQVPEVLLSGHHDRIRTWRHEQALRLTQHHRPDLMRGDAEYDIGQSLPGSTGAVALAGVGGSTKVHLTP